jgi:acetylornithine/N-succinyldiaminopimelate aminotransferase
MSTLLETSASVQKVATASAESPLLGVYRPADPVFIGGSGCTVIAEDGREYLDFAGGIAVNALGYGDAGVHAAILAALETGLIHTSNLYRTEPALRLAEQLVAKSFADKVFFCNSGGEANEASFKFARRYAREAGGEAKHEIVAFYGSFHGRLFGTLAATDRPAYRAPFEPLMPGVHFVQPDDVAGVRAVVSAERTAAIIIEPIQGESGVNPIAPKFLQALRQIADEVNAVLIFDEIQCGLGRTGSLFAYEQLGVTPDIMTLAKPIAGGLPMGAVLLTDRVAAAMHPGDHGTTFGGGPFVSTVALEVLRRVSDPSLLASVRSKGERIAAALRPLLAGNLVTDVRGAGLMWGIELREAAAPRIAEALDKGLLVISAGEKVIRLLPPLVISDKDLQRGLRVLQSVLA